MKGRTGGAEAKENEKWRKGDREGRNTVKSVYSLASTPLYTGSYKINDGKFETNEYQLVN